MPALHSMYETAHASNGVNPVMQCAVHVVHALACKFAFLSCPQLRHSQRDESECWACAPSGDNRARALNVIVEAQQAVAHIVQDRECQAGLKVCKRQPAFVSTLLGA